MSKIRESARNKECQVRLENCCCGDPATTVLAHRNGGGMGKKRPDHEAAFCCATCHAEVDRLPKINHLTSFDDAIKLLKFWDGIFRSQEIMLKEGLIKTGR
jgi:hypothetical protein